MAGLTNLANEDGVALLTLERGPTNALSHDLVRQLIADVETVSSDESFGALVLASGSDRFLSIGFDLPEVLRMDREEFTGYARAVDRLTVDLYSLPVPTIAAITGHAVAGGYILAMCCDHRYIAAGRKLTGLNEIKLGVPIPHPAGCMLRSLVGARVSRDVVESGDFFEPEEAARMGLVDRVLPLDEVLPASLDRAAELGALPRDAFRAAKRARTGPVLERIADRSEEAEIEFLECWFSAGTQERLAAAAKRF